MSLARFPALSEYDATESSSDAGSQEASGRVFGSAKPASRNGEITMNGYRKLLTHAVRMLVPGILLLLCSSAARAQLNVDCSGTNLNAYSTINAALQNVIILAGLFL
jgi:hypothetical protein